MTSPYKKEWFKQGQKDKSETSQFSHHAQARKLNQLLTTSSENARHKEQGFVSIVGAGPHDPDLLTMQAVKAIMAAEVLLYDRLVNKEILELAPPNCDWIYVGKRCGQPSIGQEEICDLMVSLAQQGNYVVRLKGGDPFVFGRGGEEALALIKASIPYDIVPGITAAIGCSANSLIPLTHRGVSRSVTFVTGQVLSGAFEAWGQLMNSGQTLVFYMGLDKSSQIQTGLIDSGLREDFPIAIITHGCSPQQQVHVAQLNQLVELSVTLKGVSPALIVMGEVVKLREQLMETVQSVAEYEEI